MPPSVGPGAKEALRNDAFRQLDMDPVYEANNTTLLGGFISGMGKIRPRSQTGLSWRSQRKVTQAIKRAKQKGVLAIMSRYPTSSTYSH
ncbi:hypothetical protein JB92DRAFT_2973531 [Gautieria morchelliformis]|nr:hypothetical protein JB92DRAFT_2973531 [Gautieria morchelliformis]